QGGSSSWWVRAFIVGFAATSTWIWIERGAPWKLWVIPGAAVGVLGWLYVVVTTPGVRPEVVEVEATPAATLIKRDQLLLQALYDATNGRPGIYVAPEQLGANLQLTGEQAQVAVERLLHAGRIEWDEDAGFAIKRKGVESVERLHRDRRRKPSVSETHNYNFHGNASGVFGSHNTVRGNTFRSDGIPAE